MRQYLGKGLLGIFHHGEKKVLAAEPAATRLQQPDQVRMGKGGCGPPMGELGIGERHIGRDELDRGIGKILCLELGEEYHAVV